MNNITSKMDLSEHELSLLNSEMEQEGKSMGIAFLLWFFLGLAGGHRFYLGNIGYAIAMLLLSWATFGIWTLIDAFFIPRSVHDYNQIKEKEIMQIIKSKKANTYANQDTSATLHTTEQNEYKNSYTAHDIPIIDEPGERNYNKPFRKSFDDDNIIRFIQKPPKGLPKKVAEYVSVAGVQKYQDNILNAITKDFFSVVIKKDPENPYDKNAIKVLGEYDEINETKDTIFGYIPRGIAADLAQYDKLDCTLKTLFLPTSTKSIGIRLDVWSKRADQH